MAWSFVTAGEATQSGDNSARTASYPALSPASGQTIFLVLFYTGTAGIVITGGDLSLPSGFTEVGIVGLPFATPHIRAFAKVSDGTEGALSITATAPGGNVITSIGGIELIYAAVDTFDKDGRTSTDTSAALTGTINSEVLHVAIYTGTDQGAPATLDAALTFREDTLFGGIRGTIGDEDLETTTVPALQITNNGAANLRTFTYTYGSLVTAVGSDSWQAF